MEKKDLKLDPLRLGVSVSDPTFSPLSKTPVGFS